MKYVCHIGPDKEDWRVECQSGKDSLEHDWAKKRDRYRKYDRPPFLKPETTQQEFYSEALKGLLIACGSARKLWLLAGDIRFQDGRSPGFIYNPTHRALVHAT